MGPIAFLALRVVVLVGIVYGQSKAPAAGLCIASVVLCGTRDRCGPIGKDDDTILHKELS